MNAPLFPDLVINGETIPHKVVAAEAQHHAGPAGKPGIAWRKAANAIAIRTLLLQEAGRRGLRAEPVKLGKGRIETEEEALIRGLLDTAIEVEPPAEADIRAEWERDPDRFRAPPLWEVSHILYACDPRDAEATAAAHARAAEITAQANANPARFAQLATDHSDCGSARAGGFLGQLGPGDTVPEFETALHGLAGGDVTSDPVLTRHGWHVIRMDAVAEGAVLPYESVRAKVSAALEKAAWASAARAYVDRLIAAAEVTGADLRPVGAGTPPKDAAE